MAQQLKALAALTQYPQAALTIYSSSSRRWKPGFHRCQAHKQYTVLYAGKTPTHIKINEYFKKTVHNFYSCVNKTLPSNL